MRVHGALELLRARWHRRELGDLFADLGREPLRIGAWLRGHHDLELAGELLAPEARVHALRDLLVVHEALVEPARLAIAEDRRGHIERGLLGREASRRAPLDVDPWRLHVVGRIECDLVGQGGGRSVLRARRRRRLRDPPKVLLYELLDLGGLDVARDHHRRVVRDVVLREEGLDVRRGRGTEIGDVPDRVPVVAEIFRPQRLGQHEVGEPVRLVLVALSALVEDHITLVIQLLLIERLGQPGEPVRLDPQHLLEEVRARDVLIDRLVARGERIRPAPRTF